MSLRLNTSTLEITDPAGGLVVDKNTALIPAVQKVSLTNVDVTFPNPSLSVYENMHFGAQSDPDPDGRAWRAYAWGLQVSAGIQSGTINLAAITAGLTPNLILANIKLSRTAIPNESIWGAFTKSILENTWMPVRSGGPLEYTAWLRRIFWFDIAGGYFRLNWKQSTRAYSPNTLSTSVFWPDFYTDLQVPPAYQIGSSYRQSPADEFFPPSTLPTPSVNSGPAGTINFGSTWRFLNINAWLCQAP